MDIATIIDFLTDIVKAKIYRKFNKPLLPRVLAYNVTSRCNCNCLMCTINSKQLENSKELNVYDIKQMFKDDILHHFHLIRFTGGEPFIKNDFIEIANIIIERSKAKITYITTNGYFTDRIVELIKNIRNHRNCTLHLQISLDGIGNTHDRIRDLDGLFDKVYNTLTAVKILQKHRKFSVGIAQVILKENMEQIKAVNNLANEFGFKHYLNFALWPNEACPIKINGDNSPRGLISNFSESERNTILKTIIDIKKKQRKQKMTVNLLRGLADNWHGDKFYSKIRLPKFTCLSLFIYFRLTSDGFVIPCILNSESKVGNIRDSNFSDIWNSKRAEDIRKEIKSCSGCWVWCDIMPSFYYSGLFASNYLKKFQKIPSLFR